MQVAAPRIGADPRRWRELGFEVNAAAVGGVRLELTASGTIASWALDGPDVPGDVDGLPTDAGPRTPAECPMRPRSPPVRPRR